MAVIRALLDEPAVVTIGPDFIIRSAIAGVTDTVGYADPQSAVVGRPVTLLVSADSADELREAIVEAASRHDSATAEGNGVDAVAARTAPDVVERILVGVAADGTLFPLAVQLCMDAGAGVIEIKCTSLAIPVSLTADDAGNILSCDPLMELMFGAFAVSSFRAVQ